MVAGEFRQVAIDMEPLGQVAAFFGRRGKRAARPAVHHADAVFEPAEKDVRVAQPDSLAAVKRADGREGFQRAERVTAADLGMRPSVLELKQAECELCLLYTSDAADDLLCVDLGGSRILKKKITQSSA